MLSYWLKFQIFAINNHYDFYHSLYHYINFPSSHWFATISLLSSSGFYAKYFNCFSISSFRHRSYSKRWRHSMLISMRIMFGLLRVIIIISVVEYLSSKSDNNYYCWFCCYHWIDEDFWMLMMKDCVDCCWYWLYYWYFYFVGQLLN